VLIRISRKHTRVFQSAVRSGVICLEVFQSKASAIKRNKFNYLTIFVRLWWLSMTIVYIEIYSFVIQGHINTLLDSGVRDKTDS